MKQHIEVLERLPKVGFMKLHWYDPVTAAVVTQLESGMDIWEVMDSLLIERARHSNYQQEQLKTYINNTVPPTVITVSKEQFETIKNNSNETTNND
jgi:hypothetical protein